MTQIMEVAGEVFNAQPSRIEPKHIQRVEKWYHESASQTTLNRRSCSCNWPNSARSAASSMKQNASIATCFAAAILIRPNAPRR